MYRRGKHLARIRIFLSPSDLPSFRVYRSAMAPPGSEAQRLACLFVVKSIRVCTEPAPLNLPLALPPFVRSRLREEETKRRRVPAAFPVCTVKKQTERSRPFMAACNYVHPSRFRIAGLKIGEGST